MLTILFFCNHVLQWNVLPCYCDEVELEYDICHFWFYFHRFSVFVLVQSDRMREVQLGSHTLRSHGVAVARIHMHDWLIFLLLVLIEIILNVTHPFYRYVGKDMMTDLRYPLKDNTVPVWAVPVGLLVSSLSMKTFRYKLEWKLM